jgi:hypothetical protein
MAVQGILAARLSEGDVERAKCPYVGCPCKLPVSVAEELLSRGQLHRYKQLLAQNYADAHPAIKWSVPSLLDIVYMCV